VDFTSLGLSAKFVLCGEVHVELLDVEHGVAKSEGAHGAGSTRPLEPIRQRDDLNVEQSTHMLYQFVAVP